MSPTLVLFKITFSKLYHTTINDMQNWRQHQQQQQGTCIHNIGIAGTTETLVWSGVRKNSYSFFWNKKCGDHTSDLSNSFFAEIIKDSLHWWSSHMIISYFLIINFELLKKRRWAEKYKNPRQLASFSYELLVCVDVLCITDLKHNLLERRQCE